MKMILTSWTPELSKRPQVCADHIMRIAVLTFLHPIFILVIVTMEFLISIFKVIFYINIKN